MTQLLHFNFFPDHLSCSYNST